MFLGGRSKFLSIILMDLNLKRIDILIYQLCHEDHVCFSYQSHLTVMEVPTHMHMHACMHALTPTHTCIPQMGFECLSE
jgi:hypothetical protein